ncbi:hypothetical protein [Rhodobacter capsulatus]|uniref:hypothetical protein n=1 Tax=Rhodobacter capsulatus TaxID=1061 RepID=UPI0040294F74
MLREGSTGYDLWEGQSLPVDRNAVQVFNPFHVGGWVTLASDLPAHTSGEVAPKVTHDESTISFATLNKTFTAVAGSAAMFMVRASEKVSFTADFTVAGNTLQAFKLISAPESVILEGGCLPVPVFRKGFGAVPHIAVTQGYAAVAATTKAAILAQAKISTAVSLNQSTFAALRGWAAKVQEFVIEPDETYLFMRAAQTEVIHGALIFRDWGKPAEFFN